MIELTEDGEEDVDAQIGTAATLKEDAQRREEDGKDDLADIAVISYISYRVFDELSFCSPSRRMAWRSKIELDRTQRADDVMGRQSFRSTTIDSLQRQQRREEDAYLAVKGMMKELVVRRRKLV